MNDADISLIISLASGELEGQARLAALSHVDADPDLARELAVQVEMIDAAQNMPAAAMTETERTTLRTELIGQLHLEAAPVASPSKRSIPWWQPLFGLASAAALVIAIVIVPGIFSSSDDSADVALQEVSSELSDGNKSVQGGETESQTQRFSTNDTDGASADAATGEGADDTMSIEAAPTTATGAPTMPEVYRIPDQREDEFTDIATGEPSVTAIRNKLAESGFASESSSINIDDLTACVDELSSRDSTGAFVPLGESERGTVFVGFDAGKGIDEIVEIDITSCTIITPVP